MLQQPIPTMENSAKHGLHEEMLQFLVPGRWKATTTRTRPERLDAFHRLKMKFIVGQRHFPLRLGNYLIYRLERERIACVHFFPVQIAVEANGNCNLRCPGCLVGRGLRRTGIQASLAVLKSVIDHVYRRSFQINFHRLGEPLLNPAFFGATRYAVEKGLWVYAHSHLSLQQADLGPKLVDARLCHLVVSCDGAIQGTYERYRRGGSLALVLKNLSRTACERERRGVRFPWLTAKFLVFEHNWHEMGQFRKIALDSGADDVQFVEALSEGLYAQGRATSDKQFQLSTLSWVPWPLPKRCPWLWNTMSVSSRGELFPCCYAICDEDVFALTDLKKPESLVQHWNSQKYREARDIFLRPSRSKMSQLPRPCHSCELVRRLECR